MTHPINERAHWFDRYFTLVMIATVLALASCTAVGITIGLSIS